MPFKSKAQQRFMFAAEERGEIPKGTAKRWAKETKNIKSLPEKKKMGKKAFLQGATDFISDNNTNINKQINKAFDAIRKIK